MKSIINLSVEKPISTGVIYVLLCLAGLFAWTKLPQEIMPDLNFPQLTIVTEYRQSSPTEIETLVTKPIEEAVGTVKNVREIRSRSKEGVSLVTLEFWWGTNMDFASLNVREKLDLVKSRLPLEIKEPVVVKYNPFATPVLIISLYGDKGVDLPFLTTIAKKTISNRLQKVKGVAAVDISGNREPKIQVDLNQNRLAAHQVPILKFNRGLQQANYEGAAGTTKDGKFDYTVRVNAPFNTVEDIRSAVVAVDSANERQQLNAPAASRDRLRARSISGDQRIISVGQVANVNEDLQERSSYSRFDGKETITIMVRKQSSASTITTAKEAKHVLEDLKPLLPSDVHFTIAYDQAALIKSGIRDVIISVLGGGILAFLMLYLFLKNWRDAVIVTCSIPASVFVTFFLMYLAGITINTISLGGLALGVGMLVDAAVCVTENIHRRRYELKEDLDTAVKKGTEEVIAPVISSTLTTVAVFLPLFFVLGLLGQLFRDLSLTVCLSLLASIGVSFTLIPTLYKLSDRNHSDAPGGEPDLPHFFELLRNRYLYTLQNSLEKSKSLLLLLTGAFIIAVLLLMIIPKQFLPSVDTNQIIAKLKMPNGTLLDKTNDISLLMEKTIELHPDVFHITATIGSSNDTPIKLLDKNEARLLIDLKPDRSASADEIIDELRFQLDPLTLQGGKFELSKAGGPLSYIQSQTSDVMVNLKGPDLDQLRKASQLVKEKLSNFSGLSFIRDSLALPSTEIQLTVNKERAARTGLTVSDIGETVQAGFHGRDVTEIHRIGNEIPVHVQLRAEDRTSISQLRSLLLPMAGGGTLPLSDVATLSLNESPAEIFRVDQERTVVVQADQTSGSSSETQNKLDSLMNQFSVPRVTIEESSQKQVERDSSRSLAFILLVSILLVYAIMAVQFESLSQPLLILITIPLSVIGMALGLFICGKTVNAMAGMGLLLLGGITVNNGIVLIDFINKSKGHSKLIDAIMDACRTRFRPILITASTTAIGLIPLALGMGEGAELQAPMAITVIFGLIVSTTLTLIAVPSLILLTRRKSP